MFIVINCMGLPFNGETIEKKSLGGSESAAYYLAKELAAIGHDVTAFTRSQEEGEWDGVRYVYAGESSDEFPLGDRFHWYAHNTPHDVLIAQRHPWAFRERYAAKICLLWLHDLALKRSQERVMDSMWQADRILTVSEWHRDQVAEVWDIDPDFICAINNGVDPSLYAGDIPEDDDLPGLAAVQSHDGLRMIYSSRPERGLESLVKPGGIMEQVAESRPDAHLFVCHYDHEVPVMQEYYDGLKKRCEELPNVTLLGAMRKQELAWCQRSCHAVMYPTSFEEVSCITAMEAMHANIPMWTSEHAALPETCKSSGTVMFALKDGEPDEKRFVRAIENMDPGSESYRTLAQRQRLRAADYEWSGVAGKVDDIIREIISERQRNPTTVLRHLLKLSDIHAAKLWIDDHPDVEDSLWDRTVEEIEALYAMDDMAEHYETISEAFFEHEYSGVADESDSLRFNTVKELVAEAVKGAESPRVLDFGCAYGHYTVQLAEAFPEVDFVGVDISERSIVEARRNAEERDLDNCTFHTRGSYPEDQRPFDAIIMAEVLEHIWEPWEVCDGLRPSMRSGGAWIVTLPYGPWEWVSYEKKHPLREHLHHFGKADIHDMFGHFPGFDCYTAPCGNGMTTGALGNFVLRFREDRDCAFRQPDWGRHLEEVVPMQTLSVCMIAKDAGTRIEATLDALGRLPDQVVVHVDERTTDGTLEALSRWMEAHPGVGEVIVRQGPSPLSVGFDEARNQSLEGAMGDWVLWIDVDEEMVRSDALFPLLRQSQFQGYCIPQHHFSVEPLGVLTTDLPARLFRNHRGVKFFGRVHEHPELELNESIGRVRVAPSVHLAHFGYKTEEIRRKRFDRNIALMHRDREDYPERLIGKFLWIRDLTQGTQYELEANGGRLTGEMQDRARLVVSLWEELLEAKILRYALDSTKWLSDMVSILGGGVAVDCEVKTGHHRVNEGSKKRISGQFPTSGHAQRLIDRVIESDTGWMEGKYL